MTKKFNNYENYNIPNHRTPQMIQDHITVQIGHANKESARGTGFSYSGELKRVIRGKGNRVF